MAGHKSVINRREFLGTLVASGCSLWIPSASSAPNGPSHSPQADHDSAIRDAIKKAENFEHDYRDDIYLERRQLRLLRQCLQRLTRVQQYVGYGNFNLIDLDRARRYARLYSAIGEFTAAEMAFIESIYHVDAQQYGFLGKRLSASLTDTIQRRDVRKIPGSGHYLYRGEALAVYEKMRKRIGTQLELTSGIRGVVKQLHLFLAKASKSGGNLSRAARSLAPPGHSYHGIGDFDVGQRGLGAANFTSAFSKTGIYRQLLDMGLIKMRYPYANPYGVRHEPWHIKVVKDA